jgi:hypothetical protein
MMGPQNQLRDSRRYAWGTTPSGPFTKRIQAATFRRHAEARQAATTAEKPQWWRSEINSGET